MKSVLIAANVCSAHGRGERILRESCAGLAEHGVRTEVVISQFDGHLLQVLPQRLQAPWDAVVALGGDGTLFQVLNCCLRQPDFDTPLGLIPAGTGNSFAQELQGIRRQPDWLRVATGRPTPIDVLSCRLAQPVAWHEQLFYFLNVMGLGFVSEVTVTSQRYKKLGALAYALGVFLTLVKLQPARLHLELDGRPLQRQSVLAAVCNTRYVGGNMKIAPQACLDDGMFEVVLLQEVSRTTLVRAFPRVFAGTHVTHPKVEILRGRHLRLEADPLQVLTPDGEVVGQTPMAISILPRRLRFLL